jgi:hypothetical protein
LCAHTFTTCAETRQRGGAQCSATDLSATIAFHPFVWKPPVELDGALERGDVPYAITLAAEVAEVRGRPIELETALKFLPLVAVGEPAQYDAWALRWLARGIDEEPATIDLAAGVAAQLADHPAEPTALDVIRQTSRPA